MCEIGKAITKVKGQESRLYKAPRLSLVRSLKFTIVKMRGLNKQIEIYIRISLDNLKRSPIESKCPKAQLLRLLKVRSTYESYPPTGIYRQSLVIKTSS